MKLAPNVTNRLNSGRVSVLPQTGQQAQALTPRQALVDGKRTGEF